MFSSFGEKYLWTIHARVKMKFYGIAESRVKRIIRFPARYEEGIAPHTVAVMQPAGTKRYSEIWAMYKLAPARAMTKFSARGESSSGGKFSTFKQNKKKIIKIIAVWRYPGKAPTRDPIPGSVLEEIKKLL